MANGGWLRLHVSVATDEKVQTLPDKLFKWWINLLCLAKGGDGLLPNSKSIAWHLRTSEAKVNQSIAQLVERELVDAVEFGFAMHDWNAWQFLSDVSTERTRRFKERQRERKGNVPENVPGSGLGTTAERPQSTEYRVQSTESELPPPTPPGGTLPKNGKGRQAIAYPPKFEEFWDVVWAKIGKDAALKQWRIKLKTCELQDIAISAAREQCRSILEQAAMRGHSPVHPATWISQGRYLDEPERKPETQAERVMRLIDEREAAEGRP